MRKIHLLMPTILVASSIPMVSMVGCGKKEPEPTGTYHTIKFEDVEIPIPAETVKDGELAIEPKDPIKEDFEFTGWEYIKEGQLTPFSWTTQIQQDYTLYPSWQSLDYDYTVTLEAEGILDLNNHGGHLGQDYLGLISVDKNYIGKYDVPNAHAYFDVTIDDEAYDDFVVNTIGTDSNYIVGLSIKEEDLIDKDRVVITPNVKVEHYLKFTAVGGPIEIYFDAGLHETDIDVYFCKNLSDPVWTKWVKLQEIELLEGESIYVWNKTPYCYTTFKLKDSKQRVAASGNIMSILDFHQLYEDCFCEIFTLTTGLTTPPFLPAVTLAEGCYFGMFQDCTSLASAPELPATSLTEGCYQAMFSNCYSLTRTPKTFPASFVTKWCCYGMFEGCSKITQCFKELPAITLAEGCYENMFNNCGELQIMPSLPAINLAANCYASMFSRCAALTTTQEELPAITLAEGCYKNMFEHCKIKQIPKLPALSLTKKCYYKMFEQCQELCIEEQDEKISEDGFVFKCPDAAYVADDSVTDMFHSISPNSKFQGSTPNNNKFYYWYTE